MNVVIVDCGSGNLRSAAKAFERAAHEAGLRARVTVTAEARAVDAASHVVVPGQGAFADCLAGLRSRPGMVAALRRAVIEEAKPFFGICVGMQLMADRGFEQGMHEGLGWIPGEVRPLRPADPTLKIPHMGWNELRVLAPDHPVLAGLARGTHVYFVHGYAMTCARTEDVLATTEYGGEVTAMVGHANMVGTQFHPEKSQEAGLRMITNFLAWRP